MVRVIKNSHRHYIGRLFAPLRIYSCCPVKLTFYLSHMTRPRKHPLNQQLWVDPFWSLLMMMTSAVYYQVINEWKLSLYVVTACPETVDLVIINSTASPSVSENRGNAINTTTTGIPSATQSFMRGTRILVRCSASSLPESKLSLSIPGLGLNNPESQNLNKTVASNGFVRGTLEGWFTLDATEDLIRANGLTVDCKAMVNNGTCASTNSLAIQLILPVTSKGIL